MHRLTFCHSGGKIPEMAEKTDKSVPGPTDRCVLVRSKMAEGYVVSEAGMKGIQHTLTDWFPRALYADLTDDTVAVDVVVRKDFFSSKNQFMAEFKRQDGEVIKNASYSEERIIGKPCAYYDPKKTSYAGKKDGFDCRLVYYSPTPLK